MLRSPEISQEDLAVLKEKIFTPDVIGSVIVDYSTFLATFRGQPNVSTIDTYERYVRFYSIRGRCFFKFVLLQSVIVTQSLFIIVIHYSLLS